MITEMYVRKLWSLNPVKFKHIRLDTAISKYESYIVAYLESPYLKNYIKKKEYPKTFKEWLRGEI